MELTGKQKSYLRSLGHKLPVAMTVGKAGASQGVAGTLKDLLGRQELLKIRLPAGDPKERLARAEELAGAAGAAVIASVGRTVLLFKSNDTLAPEKRIKLP